MSLGFFVGIGLTVCLSLYGYSAEKKNVLFIISDDLTTTALSCYGNKAARTPNIDRLAESGVRYTRAFCQYTECGPSRASFMTGFYPSVGQSSLLPIRKWIGNEVTWSQHFIKNGYQAAGVSKIFHMGIPCDIAEKVSSQSIDDARSWTERYLVKAPEWRSPGEGELLERNPRGVLPVKGGNTLEYVKAEGGDGVQADGKAAAKACELLRKYKREDKMFFLAVGFVRPHVPFVAPASYFNAFDMERTPLPESVEDDWADIPPLGMNYKTSKNLNLNPLQKRKAIAAYYAAASFMDAQVGKVLKTLKELGLEDSTIVIFTSDHGWFLGEHDFWMKLGLMEESSRVPLIIRVPGKKPAVCDSFAELIDLYPTTAELCGLGIPQHVQGKSLVRTLDKPSSTVRDSAYCVNRTSRLLRDEKWALIQHGKISGGQTELYDMERDPKQFTNLARKPEYAQVVQKLKKKLAAKVARADRGSPRGRNRRQGKGR